jgi:hypothetical protein
VQVELDALPPETLQDLYRRELDRLWDDDAYERSLARERDDRQGLVHTAEHADLDDGDEDDDAETGP